MSQSSHQNTVRPKHEKSTDEGQSSKEDEKEETENDEEERWDTEARKAETAKNLELPSQKEVDRHMITHMPFRSWCPHCVRGKAKGHPHHKVPENREHQIPTISIDYMYFVREGEVEKGLPTLVMIDDKTGMIWARVLKQKGIEEYAVKVVTKFLDLLGYTRIIVKSDGEPAIKSLKEEVKKHTQIEIVPEESPTYESKSQGKCERANQKVQEQFRAMKDALEARIGARLKEGHALVPWLVSHAGDTMNRYHVPAGGKTGYEKWKGKEFITPSPEFGERVHFLRPGTKGKDKSDVRWFEGCFLGIKNETGEIMIGNEEGVIRARDYRRMGDMSLRWNKDSVNNVIGLPWCPNPGTNDEEIHAHVRVPTEPGDPSGISMEQNERQFRRVRITPENAKARGIWINCPGCRAIRDNKPSANHTDECRESIENMLQQAGSKKLKESTERTTEILERKFKRIIEREEEQEAKKAQKTEEDKKGEGNKRSNEQEEKEAKKAKTTMEENEARGTKSSSSGYNDQPGEQPEGKRHRIQGEADDMDMEDTSEQNMEVESITMLCLNEVDLENRTTLKEVRKAIRSKKVRLLTFNEVVNEINTAQKTVDKHGTCPEAKSIARLRHNMDNAFVHEMCRIQEKNCLYYAVEGRSNSTQNSITANAAKLCIGRPITTTKGKHKTTQSMIMAHNTALSNIDHADQQVCIEINDEEVRVKGLHNAKWKSILEMGIKKRAEQQGRYINQVAKQEALITCAVDSVSWNVNEINEYWDTMSGKKLDTKMVLKARKEEMDEVRKHMVYRKVPITECRENTGREPIGTKWLDINKGDDANPEYRSRLVAQELKCQSNMSDLFAATPPWEAKKLLFSLAVTEGIGYKTGHKEQGQKLMFIDIRRAYFHSPARRKVYVRLPPEDATPGYCGALDKSMYGTRDAAQNWEHHYTSVMEKLGFKRGVAVSCLFHHVLRQIRVGIHGDDFTILGDKESLDWFQKSLAKEFELKVRGIIGPEKTDSKSIRLLNRVFEWTPQGIILEADQRHAEIITKELGFNERTKSLSTTGAKPQEVNEQEVDMDAATRYRALTARANYLAQDRSDIQFAVKELCRGMSKPAEEDWTRLKHLGRYLVDKTRYRTMYQYQEEVNTITVTTDTDYAGCYKTRKSTSGGIIQHGEHTIKTWSTSQSVVSLSSGEAEYYGMVRGAAQAIGVRSMLEDIGIKKTIVVRTDASAAKGIASRKGMGRVRHIEVNQLWLQDKVASGEIKVVKIGTANNAADNLTKYLGKEGIENHLSMSGSWIEKGRHGLMPALAGN